MDDTEKLIEQARNWGQSDILNAPVTTEALIKNLVLALRDAEKAHTPTDDEREALIREARRPQGAFAQANLVGPLADALEANLRRLDVLSVEDFRNQIADERARQIDDGYDIHHDRAHGVDHLLTWAQDYARRGRVVQAAALVEAARELLSKSPQGEPSDAEVQAAHEAFWASGDVTGGFDAIRAALRAGGVGGVR